MIYADHSATTPVRTEVLEVMMPLMQEGFGNASGIHTFSYHARSALETARERIAGCLGSLSPNELIFTSGGTEADNLAVIGLALAYGRPGERVVTTAIEHSAVANAFDVLERMGFEVVRLGVDDCGQVSIGELEESITVDTVLVSVMMANNEVGTLQPIGEIGSFLADKRALFHTDAVQGVTTQEIDVEALGIDALSLSAHKFYGPKGVGLLWLRRGLEPRPLILGGGQERGLRAGTENVPGIVGMAEALELCCSEREGESSRLWTMTQHLFRELPQRMEGCRTTGHPTNRHPGIASFVIEGVEGESLITQLDRLGVAASTGSACSSRLKTSSRVLQAIGIPEELSRGSLRLSLGRLNEEYHLDSILDAVVKAVRTLRCCVPVGV